MRSRNIYAWFVLATCTFALPSVTHAAIPFFGPIIPTMQNVCPGSWGLVITVVNNIISFGITIAIVFVAPIMIAYAGFLYVVNPMNPGGMSKAKDMLLNTVVGIVIALSAWVIVDALMAVLYDPAMTGKTWSSLITGNSNDLCLQQKGVKPGEGLNQADGINADGTPATSTPRVPMQAGPRGTACDPAVAKAGAAAGGYTITDQQAQVLACIAAPESNCGAIHNPPNYAWGRGSSAAGAWQVLLSTNSRCYENSACYGAAGVSGPLNCSSGFRGGNPIPGNPVVDQCVQAANNVSCSASAAACLLQENGGSFRPWQADVNSARQTGCITGGV